MGRKLRIRSSSALARESTYFATNLSTRFWFAAWWSAEEERSVLKKLAPLELIVGQGWRQAEYIVILQYSKTYAESTVISSFERHLSRSVQYGSHSCASGDFRRSPLSQQYGTFFLAELKVSRGNSPDPVSRALGPAALGSAFLARVHEQARACFSTAAHAATGRARGSHHRAAFRRVQAARETKGGSKA